MFLYSHILADSAICRFVVINIDSLPVAPVCVPHSLQHDDEAHFGLPINAQY